MELEKIVAANLTELRKSKQWTQLELAEKINYSDKTVSKWERGDSVPDLKTTCQLAELFGVTVDYFVTENAAQNRELFSAPSEERGYRLGISLLVVVGLWIALTMCFVYMLVYLQTNYWIIFVWGAPMSFLILGFFNRRWGKKKFDVIFHSLFFWTLLVSVYLQFLDYNIWAIFFIGIPVQIAFVLWSFVKLKYRS